MTRHIRAVPLASWFFADAQPRNDDLYAVVPVTLAFCGATSHQDAITLDPALFAGDGWLSPPPIRWETEPPETETSVRLIQMKS